MDELQSQSKTLKELGQLKATPQRLAQVKNALCSKWEGTQSAALQVLALWGGRDAIEAIRAFLVEAYGREFGWSIRGVAVQALASVVGPKDVEWVLDQYFSRPTLLEKHELLPIVLRLPPEKARGRLLRELRSDDPLNRQAAVKAIGNLPFEDRETLLKPLRRDLDRRVRESAEALAGAAALLK